MTTYYVTDASYLIALYRLGMLDDFLNTKVVYITKRIHFELVEKPLSAIQRIEGETLRNKIMQSVKEFEILIEQKKTMVYPLNYKEMSKLLDFYRHKIAKLERKNIADVKADHTIIALAVQLAINNHDVIFYSLDKAINTVLAEEISQKNLKIKIVNAL